MLNYFRHLFLPHHTNNFRAKLLHHDAIALIIFVLISLSLLLRVGHRVEPNILGYATNIHVEQLLQQTNQKRAEAGLSALKLDSQLSQAAAGKAADMFTKDYWAHTASDGTTPWDFINKSGYVYMVAGENLAKNFSDSTGVVAAWMNSSSHRENILRSQYQDIGFAVVNGVLNGEETTLVVQMFGKRLSEPVAQSKIESTPPVVIPQVAAETETREPLTGFTEPLEAAPVATTQIVSPFPSPTHVLTSVVGSVVKEPFIDIGSLTKNITLGVAVLMLMILGVDAVYVWRKRIVRAGGKHWAHLTFLFVVTVLIWSLSFGSIL